jgi:ribosomal protein L31
MTQRTDSRLSSIHMDGHDAEIVQCQTDESVFKTMSSVMRACSLDVYVEISNSR